MKRIFYIFILQFFTITSVFATHERAGEIIYKHLEGLTYEVKIITYTYAPSPADRPELEIKWGDGTTSILPRTLKVDMTPIIRRNEYIGEHTYAGPGIFKISLEDPNRNYGIVNIPNSVNIPFYIETQLIINPFLGVNNSVELLNPPLDYGCVNRLYIHNPNAYDPDGDSLSYKLTICRGAGGLPIPGYTLPAASNSFTIDELTGDLTWDLPTIQGEYNVAFIVEEWRLGQRIGYVTRDLQIKIVACDNEPPVITPIEDTCVIAGEVLGLEFSASDPNGDKLILSAAGSPFLQAQNPAVMTPNPAYGNGTVEAEFSWATNCSHIQKPTHIVYLKAKDTLADVDLSAYSSFGINVIGPPPVLVEALPIGNSINLNWEEYSCENATGYSIYRKSSYYGFVPGYCETGVPAYTGYSKIAQVGGLSVTSFEDNNQGDGLVHGIEYCYMITAMFPDGAESKASLEVCATLKKDLPIITNVSVETTDPSNGSIYVAWSKPTELDPEITPGPFQYRVLRGTVAGGGDFIEVETYYNIDDTLFFDEGLNTEDQQYRYKIDFYNDEPNNFFYIGSSVVAPSIYLKASGSDKSVLLNWNDDAPWENESYVIYRQNQQTLAFDSVGWSSVPYYADTGLINGKEYCYKVKTVGRYSATGLIEPILNFSQETCGIPVDNVPPCPPVLSVDVNCFELVDELSWTYPDTCVTEELIFYIYYSAYESSDFILYDSTFDYDYVFSTTPPSVVGCFSVTALDSLRNQSLFSNTECVDINACGRIWFPNVFTPNGDGKNEYFQADSINSVFKFDLRVFNRWGLVVYETEDPFFEWDGKDQNNNRDCAEGVYFYEGIVSEYSLRGPIERRVRGNVTLLR